MNKTLGRKGRRVPILCLILLLLSAVISAVGTPIYSIVTTIFQAKHSSSGEDAVLSYIFSALSHNVVTLSAIFIFVIAIMLIFKPKGWAVAIPCFIASSFMVPIGVVAAIIGIFAIIGQIALFLFVPFYAIILLYSLPSIFLSLAEFFFPILTVGPWLAFGLAGFISCAMHKAKKKGAKGFFGAVTVLLGLCATGLFTLSATGSLLLLINELYSNGITGVLTHIYVLGNVMIFIPLCIGNLCGFIGTILLTAYLIKPYKKVKAGAAPAVIESGAPTEAEPEQGEDTHADATVQGENTHADATVQGEDTHADATVQGEDENLAENKDSVG